MSGNLDFSRLDGICLRLLRATSASRTTIRLEIPTRGIHVDDVVAEAHAPRVKSLRGETGIDQWSADTVRFLREKRRVLLQENLMTSRTQAPSELLEIYGAQAQMLGPIFRNDDLTGWVSVHFNAGPRKWSSFDVQELETAVHRVMDLLDACDVE